MPELETYIRKTLSVIFFSIFMPLFSIASIVFLIKLATYTSVIQLSVWEMVKLFFFMIPELLFYTLPLSFFVAATLTLFKLSNDNEIIIVFALGIHPKKIIAMLFKPAVMLSILLAFNFFFIFPHAKTLKKNFIVYKKSEAKFNLSASEFGHQFGDWLLYIGSNNDDGSYADVVLFNKKQENEEILIEAKRAEIIHKGGLLRLKLSDGEGYNYSKEEFTQLNFKDLYINNTMKVYLVDHISPSEYWLADRHLKKFIINILLSIFPLISLFLIPTIGIVHARHQKAMVYLHLFLGITIYYGVVLGATGALMYYTLPALIISWLSVTYFLYRKNIVAKF